MISVWWIPVIALVFMLWGMWLGVTTFLNHPEIILKVMKDLKQKHDINIEN